MIPDYKMSARKAAETLDKYKTDDPLSVLKQMTNVLLISFDVKNEKGSIKCNFDAMSVLNRSADKTRYIVIYNQNISSINLRFALARELGHIIIGHDDSDPDDIRFEEAGCFAHYFLCSLTRSVRNTKIQFRPKHQDLLWEMKSIRVFDSMNSMKEHIVEEKNKFNRFIGKKATQYDSSDVKLSNRTAFDRLTGWKNCYNVILDGQTIGYCGE